MTIEAKVDPPRPKSIALEVKAWMTAPAMREALHSALAGYMDEPTFVAQCYIAAQDPKLSGCTAQSLFCAFLECAQMGVLPGAHHKHVALIPRAGRVDAMPQWQGFKSLMERQPGVKRVLPVLVHEKDEFSYANGVLVHRFDPFDDARVFEHPTVAGQNRRKSALRGGYLIIQRDDEPEPEYHFVSAAKIERNRMCAETQNVWLKWYPEQCLKTIIRDAWARRVISIDPQLATRIGRVDEVDNVAFGNDPARDATGQVAAGGSRVAALADRVGPRSVPSGDENLPDLMNAEPAAQPAVVTANTTAQAPAPASFALASDEGRRLAELIDRAGHPGELASVRAVVSATIAQKKLPESDVAALQARIDAADAAFKQAERDED